MSQQPNQEVGYDPHTVSTKAPPSRGLTGGRTAVWQARLVLLVMINIAQLWILSATVEAALAGASKQLIPLVAASGICWLIALSIFLWWKPVGRRKSAGGEIGSR